MGKTLDEKIMMKLCVLVLAVLAVGALAQDPPQGWLGFATGRYPQGNKITHIEAKWQTPPDPKTGGFFFGIWFGYDDSFPPPLPYTHTYTHSLITLFSFNTRPLL